MFRRMSFLLISISVVSISCQRNGSGSSASAVPAPQSPAPDDPAWDKTLQPKRYVFDTEGFSMRIPLEVVVDNPPPKKHIFGSQSKTGENVNIKYVAKSRLETLSSLADGLSKELPGFKSRTQTIVDGATIEMLTNEHVMSGVALSQIHFMFVSRDHFVMIFCTASKQSIEQYRQRFLDMCQSIRSLDR